MSNLERGIIRWYKMLLSKRFIVPLRYQPLNIQNDQFWSRTEYLDGKFETPEIADKDFLNELRVNLLSTSPIVLFAKCSLLTESINSAPISDINELPIINCRF